MREYEIRVLNNDHTLSLSMRAQELNISCAIREGRMLAQDKYFEVWRGDERIYCRPDGVGVTQTGLPLPLLFAGRH